MLIRFIIIIYLSSVILKSIGQAAHLDDIHASKRQSCGYGSCPSTDPNKINIHLVPHTHDDVGWLKTVDQYYYGQRKSIAPFGVQHILDSVIPQLMLNSNRRFIYVEMAFFTRWWNEQDDHVRAITRRLVNNGQLEFINGGWCMNDEATTTYQSIIDQMTLGLKFLNDTFGECAVPRVGWQIDPFGHSNEQASLFSQFGFDGMFFSRVHYRDKAIRAEKKALDLVWHGDAALPGDTGSIYTNVFHDHYESPSTFCFDVYCLDQMLVDNPNSYEYNIDERIATFADYIERHSASKRTRHILIPMGGDFEYVSAEINFKNMDKLIKYLNKLRPSMYAFYSTPSCYQHAINEAGERASIDWPQKVDDFFPYASDDHTYWAGYFTSRPAIKLFERQTSGLLQVARLMSLASILDVAHRNHSQSQGIGDNALSEDLMQRDLDDCLMSLWQVMGDLQHHDAVTGTEKQSITSDYMRRTTDSILGCVSMISHARKRIEMSTIHDRRFINTERAMINEQPDYIKSQICTALNISQCDLIETYLSGEPDFQAVQMSFFNPLAQPNLRYDVRVPCPGNCDLNSITILNSTGQIVPSYVAPLSAGVSQIRYRTSNSQQVLAFSFSLPPLGYVNYLLFKRQEPARDTIVFINNEDDQKQQEKKQEWLNTNEFNTNRIEWLWSIDSSLLRSRARNLRVVINMGTGMIERIVDHLTNDTVFNMTHHMGWYYPSVKDPRSSGAYILRPDSRRPMTLLDKPEKFKIVQLNENTVLEIHQQWNDWIYNTIRLHLGNDYIEYDYVVGPIPIDDGLDTNYRRRRSDKRDDTSERNAGGLYGREVISRFQTTLKTQGVFYTDSNGRQLVTRVRNTVRPHVVENVTIDDSLEPVASNYYPVTSTIMLRDEVGPMKMDFAVLTDRSQAGASLADGQLELLVHRRCMIDDKFGVNEPLNEPGEDGRGLVVRGQHRIFIEFHGAFTDDNRLMQHKPDDPQFMLLNDPIVNMLRIRSTEFLLRPSMIIEPVKIVTLSENNNNRHPNNQISDSDNDHSMQNPMLNELVDGYSILNETLPLNINLLTVQMHSDTEILLRFENLENPLTIHRDLLPPLVYSNILDTHPLRETGQEIKILNTTATTPLTTDEPMVTVPKTVQLMNSRCKLERGHHYQRRHGKVVRHWCTSRWQEYTSRSAFVEERLCKGTHAAPLIDTYIDTEHLFKNIRITQLREMVLGANVPLDKVNRLKWRTKRKEQTDGCDGGSLLSKSTIVTIGPRQIKTFLASFAIYHN